MNIAIVGHVCIDKNTSEKSSYISAGGSSMFMYKILKQLPDCSPLIISSYGKDFIPYTKNLALFPTFPITENTLIYENKTKKGIRTQFVYNQMDAKPVPFDENLIKKLKEADILFIAPLLPNFSGQYIQHIMRYVPDECLKILSPQGYFRKIGKDNRVEPRELIEADTILPFFDAVITSQHDFPHIQDIAIYWAKKHKTTFIITLAEHGALLITENQKFQISTKPVKEEDIIDAVGSGDIFTAGFAYWYKKTKDLKAAITFANKIARACLFYTPDSLDIDYKKLVM